MENIGLWAVINAINQFIEPRLKIYDYYHNRIYKLQVRELGGPEKNLSQKNLVGKTQDRKCGMGQAPLASPARTSRLL